MRNPIGKCCELCMAGFIVSPSRKGARFCSRECLYESSRKYFTCETCGEDTQRRRGPDQRYCSRECAYEDIGEWHDALPPEAVPTKTSECRMCGSLYLVARLGASRFTGAYCSVSCEEAGVQRTCRHCGEPFRAERAWNEAYCGDECRAARDRERGRQRWDKMRQGQRHTRRMRRKVCCEACSTEFMADSGQKYCSVRCRPSRNSDTGRHLSYLMGRDRRRCGICGQAVAWTKEWPHPRSPTVDHIVPRSRGGTDELHNLQLAHWECNEAKGAGSVGSQLLCVG